MPVAVPLTTIYPTSIGIRSRIINQTVTGASLTNATTPSISTTTWGTYYNITNSAFSAATFYASDSTANGNFYVLRNATGSYLSVTPTYVGGGSGLPSPIVIPPYNSATVVWTGTAYLLF